VIRGAAPALFIGLAALVTGCGSKGAVAVFATVQSPSASVTSSLLAHQLNGELRLHLELGQYAPSSTDVGIQTMSLVRPTDQSTLLVLKLTAAPAPPYHLEPGGQVDAVVTIAASDTAPGQAIMQTDLDAICQAKMVEFSGSLSDSAAGQPIPVNSGGFMVSGCP
jgi:hypothetical protein